MRAEAEKILPGAGPWEALAHLDEHGTHIEGVEEVRVWLQALMDEAIEALDGTHFELAERVRKVESRIAPPGGAAAPYYTGPSEDFSRPGRTWLPVDGETRFPVYDLVSTWYHEGVPGHHLQIAQWVHVADQLSRYQATIGLVSANAEGWALYAERLMDELGFLPDPERRLGYLDCQMMRACRVIVDIGMHLGLEIPADSPFHPGERWTPELAQEFFQRHTSRPPAFVESELTRYLSMPGQAIGYKLGERAWLLALGRAAPRLARPGRPGGRTGPAVTAQGASPGRGRDVSWPGRDGSGARPRRSPCRQQPQSSASTGAVSGSASRLRTPSHVSYAKPSRAQYSKPPSISLTW
jgi:uncharacterized protein (DUF885 family)